MNYKEFIGTAVQCENAFVHKNVVGDDPTDYKSPNS